MYDPVTADTPINNYLTKIPVDTSGGAVVLTLVADSKISINKPFLIANVGTSANTITINTDGVAKFYGYGIDGAGVTSLTIDSIGGGLSFYKWTDNKYFVDFQSEDLADLQTQIDELVISGSSLLKTLITFTAETALDSVIDCTSNGLTWTKEGDDPELGVNATEFNESSSIRILSNGKEDEKPSEIEWISNTSIKIKRIYEPGETLFIYCGSNGEGGGSSASAIISEVIANEDLLKLNIVTTDYYKADSSNVNQRFKILGVVLDDTNTGFEGQAQVYGELEDLSWYWPPTGLLFLNGTSLSITPPPDGHFNCEIGKILSSTKIFIDIQEGYLI